MSEKNEVKKALDYCRRHKVHYVRDAETPKDGENEYREIVKGLKDGSIQPDELPMYGMDFSKGGNVERV